jgi:hypothetical protein
MFPDRISFQPQEVGHQNPNRPLELAGEAHHTVMFGTDPFSSPQVAILYNLASEKPQRKEHHTVISHLSFLRSPEWFEDDLIILYPQKLAYATPYVYDPK